MESNEHGNIPKPPPLIPTTNQTVSEQRVTQEALIDAIVIIELVELSILINLMSFKFSFSFKSITRCYGFNKNIGVKNLCINNSKRAFLCASHIGIVYDFDKNEQHLLQGHVSLKSVFINE